MQLGTEFSFRHGIRPVEITEQLHSHVADSEERGVLHLLCFGSGLGKLLRQLFFVACNAVSSYPTANSLPPPSRPQRRWKKGKQLLLLLTILAQVSVESSSLSILPLQTPYGFEAPAWNHLLSVEPGIPQHCASILFLVQRDCKFQKEIK